MHAHRVILLDTCRGSLLWPTDLGKVFLNASLAQSYIPYIHSYAVELGKYLNGVLPNPKNAQLRTARAPQQKSFSFSLFFRNNIKV